MKGEQKKLISLPVGVVGIYNQLAEGERTSVKAYMERVLIQHANAEGVLIDSRKKTKKK